MENMKHGSNILSGNLKNGRHYLEDLAADGKRV
jgi:hypothetical protein